MPGTYVYIVMVGALSTDGGDHIDEEPIATFTNRTSAAECVARLKAKDPYAHQYTHFIELLLWSKVTSRRIRRLI